MYPIVRPLLFRLRPERAHDLVLRGLGLAGASALARGALARAYAVSDPRLAVTRFGLRFRSPVGLAAGLDKDAEAVPALAALGFGHLELGSVTAHAQPGNPRPRLFRLIEDEALINRMGFNNRGAAAMAERLVRLGADRPAGVPLGVNVGKSRVVPASQAGEDYQAALRAVWPVSDFVVLNVSSPNTPGLRSLQQRAPLEALLARVMALRSELGARPVLLKISPDLSDAALREVAAVAEHHAVDGLIATNTSLARGVLRSPRAGESGGLSGRPLRQRSLEVLRLLHAASDLPLISVGGVWDGLDVLQRLEAGASLVQLYSAFIYQGPAVLPRIARTLLDALERERLDSVESLIGRGAPRARPQRRHAG